jgi:hypothetical protein
MPYINVGTESNADIGSSWERRERTLLGHGYRCITYDRRAHSAPHAAHVCRRLRDERLIADLTVVEIVDGPHNIASTHSDEVNSVLLAFPGTEAAVMPEAMAS